MDKLTTIPGLGADIAGELARGKDKIEQAKALASKELRSAKEMEKATSGFEALMLHEMLKSMWATVGTTGFLGEDTHQAKIYRDMLNQALSESIAEGRGIGVKEFLREELIKLEPASKNQE
ncbi:hypothetical protein BVY02_01005 [bacterium J17]|nr:hypothetical protein BVY02_01005 [bacterium J17]